jgi:hypothetical protein
MLCRSAFGTCQLATLVLSSTGRDAALISTARCAPRWTLTRVFSSHSSFGDRIFASDELDVYHTRRTVDSTQDEVKRMLNFGDNQDKLALALIADSQSNGRGTGGRTWHASDGNVYLTCAIATEMIPLPQLTLMPVGIGVLIAELIWKELSSEPAMTDKSPTGDGFSQGNSQYSPTRPVVKWPNDVLLNG